MTRTSRCTSIHRGRGADEDRMSRSGGFSRIRLGRMHDVMARHVAQGEAPGIVTALRRHGEVHVDAIGTKAVGGAEPMRRDTIFRITSMTKPVTAVAAMILVEECKLRLDEPVDRLLPELAEGPPAARRTARRHRPRAPPDHRARFPHLPPGPRHDHGATRRVSDPEGCDR